MLGEHENIADDQLIQLYFKKIHADSTLMPAHWHSHLEIICIVDGYMTAYINEISYELRHGDILVVNPKDIHYTNVNVKCCYYLLQIPTVHLKRICEDWKLLHFSEYIPEDGAARGLHQKLTGIFEELDTLEEKKEKGHHLLFLQQVYQLLYVLYTEGAEFLTVQNKSKTERDLQRIEKSMEYVRRNYTRQLSLAEVSAELSVSPEYFCRLFRRYTGQTFLDYVNQIRLLHFYQELLQTDESVTYLLDKNGITNYKTFMKNFKKSYGMTPHLLRKEFRTSKE